MTHTQVFNKITSLLAEEEKPPAGKVNLGLWMARHVTYEEFDALFELEAMVGEDSANQQLVQAMIASGKYKSDDSEFVELVA